MVRSCACSTLRWPSCLDWRGMRSHEAMSDVEYFNGEKCDPSEEYGGVRSDTGLIFSRLSLKFQSYVSRWRLLTEGIRWQSHLPIIP
mmetsp:Transcript_9543/g.19520  ORF Transcript_9543/g.19520 Transcript_9543/m.19520 type:complete len:87 (-) Transcript_9543:338-598(-)